MVLIFGGVKHMFSPPFPLDRVMGALTRDSVIFSIESKRLPIWTKTSYVYFQSI